MFKFIKNKFLFIVVISCITLVLLIVGAISLHKDTSQSFSDAGYVLSTTKKQNAKYYFTANTKYKDNADNKVSFKDEKNKSVTVDPTSFVHYNDGSIGYLTRGALVNLDEVNSSIISYYNVNRDNLIEKDNNKYNVKSNGKDINVSAFVGRISDKKYIIAGSNLSLEIPNKQDKVTGDYFEVLFIENGIVKIDNKDVSFQVTAQDSNIYVNNNIIINLGNQKIYYDGSAKMLLSQITINGNENIDLDVNNKNGSGGDGNGSGNGSGNGTGTGGGTGGGTTTTTTSDGAGGDGDGTREGAGSGDGTSTDGIENGTDSDTNTTGDGTGDGTGSNDGSGSGSGSGTGGKVVSTSAKVELISADVTSTTIDLAMQLNNASALTGTLVAQLTNIQSGEKETPISIPAVNGTFKVTKVALHPDTEYNLTIIETDTKSDKQYFQKTFKTKKLGISLEKQYATDTSLAYDINFDENSEVEKVKVSIYDNNGANDGISPNTFIVSKTDLNKTIEFIGLNSNSSYSVNVETIWIGNVAYTDLYTINRIDTTLTKTPTLSNIEVKANAEEVKFNIKIGKIDDPDNSISAYIYKIYKADSIGLDNKEEPELVYTTTKNDSDPLELNLNEIKELKTGVDYRCKVIAQYYDNEMVRESESDYSGNFLIKSKPNVSFKQETATMNKIIGTLTLTDANCSVPVNGRSCLNEKNNFILRYYKLGDDETSENDTQISFNPNSLDYKLTMSNLSSDTTYVVKVYGNYYDDDNNLHTDVQIGDPFYVKTDESENLKLKIIGDNKSGTNKDGTSNPANVVTFDAVLSKPQDSNINEEVSSISLKLYSGSYNVADKLIGSYTIKDKATIEDFFSSYTITNTKFINEKLGALDSLQKMIQITANSTNTLNGTYTVEIDKVLDSTGKNEIKVEDNIYTFKLTPSYYLDSRIETNQSYKYINVTKIMKKDLSEEEYATLAKTIKNLDELNDDTVVGVTIENSISDSFVDSAFTYEKVIVDYVIYNSTTKREIKRESVDMGNKYQPKSRTIYLDATELDDGKKYFTRGYDYKISYELNFKTESGDNPTYTNKAFESTQSIERQMPIITQYVSNSTTSSVTYRYSIKDIDEALYDKKMYYTTTKNTDYNSSGDELVVDGEYHDVVIPLTERDDYSVYINTKNTKGKNTYTEIAKSEFESNYEYGNEKLYDLVNDNDNTLKIKFKNNDITNRAVAYKVVIKAKDSSSIAPYTRYFLASKLLEEEQTTSDESETPAKIKYISIDYANINKFMGHNLEVAVTDYYDTGLVGINQKFPDGLVLENKEKGKYLNIYNAGSDVESTTEELANIDGIYMLRESYEQDSDNIFIYNYLENTKNYKLLDGVLSYGSDNLDSNIGIRYNLSMTRNGLVFNYESKDYEGYNLKKLRAVSLSTSSNQYRFNSITPRISVDTSKSTINSIKLDIKSSGIYGQFTKNGQPHNKYYIDIYSDAELTNKLTTLTSDLTIKDGQATSDIVEYKNLKPDTLYYVTISAYLDGKLTRLYDIDSKSGYVLKTYEAKTLSAENILEKITLSVNPVEYAGESSKKELKWRLKFRNTENYKVRFELYDKDNKQVNFDGTEATKCNTSSNGASTNAYVNGCYIQVDKSNIADINNKNQIYNFTGDNFVFGGSYYKLIVYAVPFTNGNYQEDDKIILYQNDSLSSTQDTTIVGKTGYYITIPTLEEATFDLNNTLVSGYRGTDNNGEYYIEFTPTVNDLSKVIKYGKYQVNIKDSAGKPVQDPIDVNVNSINKKITFSGLSANTLYYIELSYQTYRNNNGLTEDEKINSTPFTDFIYTPVDAGITLGTITAQQNGNKKVILAYNGASNMTNNIKKVKYTISQKGSSSKVQGEYQITLDNPNIFEISADKTPKLTLDFTDNNNGFSLKAGNTYIISTKYWYEENGKLVPLKDKVTDNDTFTAILNL